MKASVYLETTVISYLTSKPTRDLIVSALQELTKEWWELRRRDFDIYISQSVVRESRAGDIGAARKRLQILKEFPVLAISDEATELSKKIVSGVPLPPKAIEDAFHIAIATVNEVDYLLTWNCKHIANAVIVPKIELICKKAGFSCPRICTPQELMEREL